MDRSISLDELAEVAYFSPFHFHRIFVVMTGESVNFLTNKFWLEKAARLLKRSKEAIGGTAEQVAAYPAEIKEFSERRVAYILVMDSYREGVVIEAFRQMIDWTSEAWIYAKE